jgi:hypothetical protein
MANEEKVRRAISTAQNLPALHNGDRSYLVLVNEDGIDYTDATLQKPDSLAEWDIAGVIVCSGTRVVWVEVFPDHGFPPMTEEEIATAMEWDGCQNRVRYTTDYRAAQRVALVPDRQLWRGHHRSMGRVIIEGPRAFDFMLATTLPGREQGAIITPSISGKAAR